FAQHLATEAEQRSGPTAGSHLDAIDALHQPAALDQATEVLGVQTVAGQRLHHPLQAGQGEAFRQQLEHHRAVLQLAAQPPQRGRQDAAMIEGHGAATGGQRTAVPVCRQ
ncbi:hypothetical protein RZS08_01590, partial [Arthrospira platensis SPKY1]|nr:hypothetical protein [Arthrospira platensis SPKY1]